MAYANLKKAKRKNKKIAYKIETFNIKKIILNNFNLKVIIIIIYFTFCVNLFKEQFIGEDIKHTIFIFIIPTIIGIVFIGYLFRKTLREYFVDEANFFERGLSTLFILIGLSMYSVLTFYTGVDCIWKYWIINSSKFNKIESFECEINEFRKGSSSLKSSSKPRIDFIFKMKRESIKVRGSQINPYIDKNPNDYKLIITARKTAWDYYILENWWVEDK